MFTLDPLWPRSRRLGAAALVGLGGRARGVRAARYRLRGNARGRRARPLDRAQELPASASIGTFTYRGDKEALIAACRDADAILTDYVPFDDSVLQPRPLPHHLGRRHRLGLRGRRGRSRARHRRQLRRRVLHAGSRGPHAGAHPRMSGACSRLRAGAGRRDWRWNEVRDVQRLAGRTMGLDRLRAHRPGGLPPRARLRPRGAGVGPADRR